jgi:hypothetical protein
VIGFDRVIRVFLHDTAGGGHQVIQRPTEADDAYAETNPYADPTFGDCSDLGEIISLSAG